MKVVRIQLRCAEKNFPGLIKKRGKEFSVSERRNGDAEDGKSSEVFIMRC